MSTINTKLLEALKDSLKALDAIADEMTIGERYTNAGQHLLDAMPPARAAIAEAEAAPVLASQPQQAAEAVDAKKLPGVCDGKEQDQFEEWARKERYDMSTHPLHWLFLNEKTYAARQGWKAAIRYVCAALAAEKGAKP